MTSDSEILAELVKANETLAEMKRYARFSDQVLKISIVLGAVSLGTAFALVFIASR
jgi:hypothetical protein